MTRFDDDGRDPVTIAGAVCVVQREQAIQVLIEGERHWIPQSVVHEDSEVWQHGQTGKLIVHKWFARREGLPYEED